MPALSLDDMGLGDAPYTLDDLGLEGVTFTDQPAGRSSLSVSPLDSLARGTGDVLRNYAATADSLGVPGLGDWFRSIAPTGDPDVKPAGQDFMEGSGSGRMLDFNLNALPDAVIEQVPQAASAVAGRAAGMATGAAIGSVAGPPGAVAGAAIGGLAGPFLAEFAQQLGPTVQERARRRAGDPNAKPTAADWAWAAGSSAASGALDTLGLGHLRAGGVVRALGREAATEGAQSVVQQVGETAATPGGLEIDPKQVVGEAALGGLAGGVIDTASGAAARGAERALAPPESVRVRGPDDVALAQRIEGRGLDLNIREPGQAGGAEEAAKSTGRSINTEATRLLQELQAEAVSRGDFEVADQLAQVKTTAFGAATSSASAVDLAGAAEMLPGDQRVRHLLALARQRARLNPFLRQQGTVGGVSTLTRWIDPWEKKATGAQRAVATAMMVGSGGTLLFAGPILNRLAKAIDRRTGRYSPVETFVRNANRSGIEPVDTRTASETQRRDIRLGKMVEDAEKRQFQADYREARAADADWNAQMAANARAAQQAQQRIDTRARDDRLEAQAMDADWNARMAANATAAREAQQRASALAKNEETAITRTERAADVVSGMAFRRDRKGVPGGPEGQTGVGPAPQSGKAGTGEAARADATGNSYFSGGEQERMGWVDYYRSLIRGTPAEPPPGLINSGAHKVATGQAATAERVALAGEIAGLPADSVPAAVQAELGKMDSRTALAPDRAASRQRIEALLDGLDDPVSERQRRLAANFELIAPTKAPAAPKASQQASAETTLSPEVVSLVRALAKTAKPPAEAKAVSAKADITPLPADLATVVREDKTAPADPAEVLAQPQPAPAEARRAAKNAPERVKKAVQRLVSGRSRGKTLSNRLGDREAALLVAAQRRGEYPALKQQIEQYTASESPAERIKGLILKGGSEYVPFSGLVGEYASLYNSRDPVSSAEAVAGGVRDLIDQGVLSSVYSTPAKREGRFVKAAGGKQLYAGLLRFNRKHPFMQALDLAKSWGRDKNSVDVSSPHAPAGPEKVRVYPPTDRKVVMDRVDTFVNALRQMGTGIHRGYVDLLHKAVEKPTTALKDSLIDPNNGSTVGLDNLAQIGTQLPAEGPIFQEFQAGANGRVYAKNGSATTQGGDLMKALTRAPFSKPPGIRGLADMFQHWGNVFGASKESILARWDFVPEHIGDILAIADRPFADNLPEAAKKLLSAEGPHQATAAALDIKSMVSFALARPTGAPYKAKADYANLLKDPAVIQDLAKNWSTDAVVQFDGNNNAYQIMGLLRGDQSLLEATGMAVRPEEAGSPPSERQVADMYAAPARLAIEASLPELAGALGSADGRKGIRSVFKNAITTMLYDSSPQTESRSILNKLLANPGIVDKAALEASITDAPGGEFAVGTGNYRVQRDGDVYRLQRKGPKGWSTGSTFASPAEARQYAALNALSVRASAAVRKRIIGTAEEPGMYPGIRETLSFFQTIGQHLKETQGYAYFPTPDGQVLRYDFRDVPEYGTQSVSWRNTKGKDTDFSFAYVKGLSEKKVGRGMAAFLAHSHDAYVMRQAAETAQPTYYNTIHDSHGFHPAESSKGRMAVVAAMLGLKNTIYKTPGGTFDNVLEAIMSLNGMDPKDPMTWPPGLRDRGIPAKGKTTDESPDNLLTAVS